MLVSINLSPTTSFRFPSPMMCSCFHSDVIFSAIGAIIWTAALIAWIIIFQTQRAAWGDFADAISYIIPTGIP